MADTKHVHLLLHGVGAWNAWRKKNPAVRPDLAEADLSHVNLIWANLRAADLSEANLSEADLREANLSAASLSEADLSEADLRAADLSGANLSGANLRGAGFLWANLSGANLSGANLSETSFFETTFIETIFGDTDLGDAKDLGSCKHIGPSTIDLRTLQQSGSLPLAFLRGCGLPDNVIDYLPSLLNQPIQFYSCFISYASRDQAFADRLHADLQNQGVRCWFAPHDLPIGAKTWDAIDEAIRHRDKLLLILSDASIASDWVEDEVTKAFAEERGRQQLVLFPIRIDDAVLETAEPWAVKLRDNRNIGDFRRWKEHDAYQASLERLLRDLKRAALPG